MNPPTPSIAHIGSRVLLTLALVLALGPERWVRAEQSPRGLTPGLEALSLEQLLDLAVQPLVALEAEGSLRLTGFVARHVGAKTLGDVLDLMGLDVVPMPAGRAAVLSPRPGEVPLQALTVDGASVGLMGVVPARLLALPVSAVSAVSMLLVPRRHGHTLLVHVDLLDGEGLP